MKSFHNYQLKVRWTGNLGAGTSDYRAYSRDHVVEIDGKPEMPLSSDPAFRGDKSRHNPEEMLVASLSCCHMLWFLHLCAEVGIIVTGYEDKAEGLMDMNLDGSGQFREVTLHPKVTISDIHRLVELDELHHRSHTMCFIARSVNFPVRCEATGIAQPETV